MLALCLCGATVHAQSETPATAAPDVAALEQRLAAQEARLQQQEARLQQQESRLQRQEAREPLFGFGNDGFSVSARFFSIRLRALIQADARDYFDTAATPLPAQFLLRRVRPIVEGTVGDVVDFKIVPDFGQGSAILYDAYVDLRPYRWIALRIGKFKTPFGLERLQNDANMAFNERGLPSDLVPDRDIGASLHGDLANGTFVWELGIFDGALDNNSANQDGDTNDGKDLIARVFSHPFRVLRRAAVENLGFGVAASWGKQHGSAALPGVGGYKSTGQNTFFSYLFDAGAVKPTVIAIGDRYRVSPQLYWYVGPVGLLAEYVYDATTVSNFLSGAEPRKALVHQAWQTELQVVLTGERAGFNGVKPKHPFNPRRLYFGALELAARYGQLRLDPATFPSYADPTRSANAALEWGVGFNWYLLAPVKIAVDFERTTFHGGAGNGDRRPENALLARAQLSF
ncbi:MAG TPA: porin [Polyangia bacterium]